MRLGIVSDSHDNSVYLAEGVHMLQERGAEFFIHCGDICSPDCLDELAGLKAAFVWGNCDWDRVGLQRYARTLGIQCFGAMGELELDGRNIAFIHGDDAKMLDRLLAG